MLVRLLGSEVHIDWAAQNKQTETTSNKPTRSFHDHKDYLKYCTDFEAVLQLVTLLNKFQILSFVNNYFREVTMYCEFTVSTIQNYRNVMYTDGSS